MIMKKGVPLAFVVTLYTALVIALAMAAYAVFQYLSEPAHTVLGLLWEHGWHVLALGFLTFGALYLILLKKIVHPIRALYLKLYGISRGNFSPISMRSGILEIREIAEGVNLVLAEMNKPGASAPLEELAEAAAGMKALAEDAKSLSGETRKALLESVGRIQDAVEVIRASGPSPWKESKVLKPEEADSVALPSESAKVSSGAISPREKVGGDAGKKNFCGPV